MKKFKISRLTSDSRYLETLALKACSFAPTVLNFLCFALLCLNFHECASTLGPERSPFGKYESGGFHSPPSLSISRYFSHSVGS